MSPTYFFAVNSSNIGSHSAEFFQGIVLKGIYNIEANINEQNSYEADYIHYFIWLNIINSS